MDKTKKVFVGLSGGVDSSVSAYLLQEQGYEVVGVHLKCWNRDGCDEREARDARLVANKLDIPFYVFDMEKEYKERVVDYMVGSYASGLTPNPDVMCNKEIKFGLFFDKAISMGADCVATG
ncbi:MAG: 7-cyano-7-deazaguanine synthase, partial [Patescibacteria group bacterium]|nr:7-cyano-7-deazaguanine synthase [Patescibacteria group bacterium]